MPRTIPRLTARQRELLEGYSAHRIKELNHILEDVEVPLKFTITYDSKKITKEKALEAINHHLEILNDTMDIFWCCGVELGVTEAEEI